MSTELKSMSLDTRFEIHDSDGKVRGAFRGSSVARDEAQRLACDFPTMSFYVMQVVALYKSYPSIRVTEYNRT